MYNIQDIQNGKDDPSASKQRIISTFEGFARPKEIGKMDNIKVGQMWDQWLK
jgi:hypothetical protein